jgi:hypothetical protein
VLSRFFLTFSLSPSFSQPSTPEPIFPPGPSLPLYYSHSGSHTGAISEFSRNDWFAISFFFLFFTGKASKEVIYCKEEKRENSETCIACYSRSE